MENSFLTAKSTGNAELVPGPLYPDHCLECPELLVETYGGVRHCRCVDCLAASNMRQIKPEVTPQEDTKCVEVFQRV